MSDFGSLFDALGAAGLWAGVSSAERELDVVGLMELGHVLWPGGGVWMADGEELADGSIQEWVASVAPALADVGVQIDVETLESPLDTNSTGYEVRINEGRLRLYDLDPTEPGLPLSEDPWLDCTVKPIQLLNRTLEAAGSDRRLAVFWAGGNDGCVVMGPKAVFERMSRTSWAQVMGLPA